MSETQEVQTPGAVTAEAEQTVAATSQPGSTPPAQQVARVDEDWTQSPAFREFQSKQDKRLAAERAAHQRDLAQREQALKVLQDQMAQMNERLSAREQEQLDALPEEQQVAVLKRMLQEREAREKQEREAQARAQVEQAKAQAKAQQVDALLKKHGIGWDDPGLKEAIALGATDEGLTAMLSAIADIVAERAEKRAAQMAEEASKARQKGKAEALRETGATATSSATGEAADEASARQKLITRFKKRLEAMRGTGIDNPAYLRLLTEMRTEKVTFEDFGR